MNSPRRDLLKLFGLNGLLSVVPTTLLALLPKLAFAKNTSSTPHTVINHVFVHFPEGTSVETANRELEQWTKCIGYTDVLESFKRDGRLFSYRISRAQNPFVVELHMKSMAARQELIQALEAHGIFNESKRLELGYKMSETLYQNSNGLVSAPQQIRNRT